MIEIDDLSLVDVPKQSRAAPVLHIEDIRAHVPAMIGYVRRAGYGYLTAPQVGLNYTVMITYLEGDYARVFINPSVRPYGRKLPTGYREHATVHALNLKDEQFILDTKEGYYAVVPSAGKELAKALQDAMRYF